MNSVEITPWIVEFAVKSSIVLMVTGAVAFVFRRASAASRHLIWGSGIAACLVVPALSALTPRWEIPVSSPLPAPSIQASSESLLAAESLEIAPGPTPVGQEEPPRIDSLPTEALATADEPESTGERSPAMAPAPPLRDHGTDRSSTFRLPGWGATIGLLWLAGTSMLLIALLVGVARVYRLGRRAGALEDARLIRIAVDTVHRLGITRRVRFLEGPSSTMPLTWGAIRPTVLLPHTAHTWSDDRVRAVLLHELAHVRRFDYLTHLMGRIACALYWFNPFVWLAVHHLRTEREHACDDAVLRTGSTASDYASHLLDIAKESTVFRYTVSVAMARSATLGGRLRAVLDATRRRGGASRGALFGATAFGLLIALPVAGARLSTPADDVVPEKEMGISPVDGPTSGTRSGIEAPAPMNSLCNWTEEFTREGRRSTMTQDDGTSLTVRIETERCEIRVDSRGEIEFASDRDDITGISSDGRLTVEERRGSERRSVRLTRGSGGMIEREWRVNDSVQPWGPEATSWWNDILPTLFRTAGLNAEPRARRFLAQDGPDGLLDEVSLIRSDGVAQTYFGVLLAEEDLDDATIRRAVAQAGEEISSDHALGELLIYVAENQPLDDNVRLTYLNAAGTISSDHEHSRVLSAILGRDGLSREVADGMLRSAQNISSDHELSELLIEMIELYPIQETFRPVFFETAATISSDHSMGEVVMAALRAGSPSVQILDQTLELAGEEISSDHELGEILIRVADLYPIDQSLPASFVDAARSISSDREQARVLRSLVVRDSVSDAILVDVLRLSREISSDREQADLLLVIIDRHGVDDSIRNAFMDALEGVSSRRPRDEVMTALGRAGGR